MPAFLAGVVRGMSQIGALLMEHLNFLAFALGFVTLYSGIRALSPPIANIVAGLIVMTAAVWPYLHFRRGTR